MKTSKFKFRLLPRKARNQRKRRSMLLPLVKKANNQKVLRVKNLRLMSKRKKNLKRNKMT